MRLTGSQRVFGKHFASTYTGSMFGAGAHVFSVWGYVIANTVNGQVELNPKLLAALIGTDVSAVDAAIAYLCAPDAKSRSKAEEGRRLVREGEFAYRVVNHGTYREIRHEEDRRAYNRLKKAEERARKSRRVKTRVNDSQAMSAHTEAEAETEAVQTTKQSVRATEPPDPRVKVFLEWFVAEFKNRRAGADYLVKWGKHGALVKPMLRATDLERLKKCAVIMLSDRCEDDFIVNSDRGIEVLSAKFAWLQDRLAQWEARQKRT